MHGIEFLQDLAVVMMVAAVVTIICHRFKQPVVLGYIVAGIIIGPHTPPFPLIHSQQTINTLSELGIILLMFGLGLEFSLRKLKQVGAPAVIAALLEIILMVWVGYEIGRVFGWSTMDSIFLGAILSVSSTTIIIKALGELGKTRERFAQLIFGILIIEDILGIAMIALLSGIAMTGTLSIADVGLTLGKLSIFLVAVLVVGLIAVPRLLGYVAKFKSNEMLLITSLGLCFGVSLLAVKLGYSVALGAFIIGAVIAESREIHRIENLTAPVRDMFSAIFFVAIGLLIDPKMLVVYWLPILVITIAVIVGKVFACSLGAFAGGNDTRTSLRVGMGLAQIGEFSFIIASLGLTLKVTSGFLYPIAVAVSVITTLTTPYLIKSSDALVTYFDRVAPRSMVDFLSVYTRWVGQLGNQHPNMARALTRRWIFQISLNAALITAVFFGAVYYGQHPPSFLKEMGFDADGIKAFLWLTATIASLPMFIASFRKLQALGMLIAETKVTKAAAGERTRAIRQVVAQIVPLVGSIGLGIYVLLLSSALLPTFKVFVVLLILVILIGGLLWRSFIKVYSKAQIALHETLSQTPPAHEEPAPKILPPLLREADLETITLNPDAPVTGKRIADLRLRTVSGASIVGIERGGKSIINPGPEEELRVDDQLLLLGTRTQLEAARTLLSR